VTYACKDFLNQPAQGTVDEATLTTRSGVEGSLIAAYRALDCDASSAGSWGCAASNWVWSSIPGGDAYKGSNLGDQQPINDIETHLWSVGDADAYINQKWAQAYEGVSRANAALRLLEAVVTQKPTEISTADAKSIRGEATFLRAHYHFEAYRMWGHIPYYNETDTDLRTPNDLPLDSIVKLIIADLDTAIAYLPAAPRNGEKGRVTSFTARAYKGRVQVYGAALNPAYWAQALATLNGVKNDANNPYGLETSFNHVWTAYPAYRNGPETILAFQASVKDGEPSGWNSNWGERLNFPHSGSHFGCCGFHQPSFNLVNFFQVDAAGLPVAMTSSAWNTPVPDTNMAAGVLRPVDPRLDWTVGRDRVPYKDWGLHNRSWIRDASYSGPYSPKKNVQEQAANAENNVGWQATQTNDVHIHIFRYADMLLLLAEAEVETGNLGGALTIGAGGTRVRDAGYGGDERVSGVRVESRAPTAGGSVGGDESDARHADDAVGDLSDRPLSGAVPEPGVRAAGGSYRAAARAGDGRPAVLRPAALGWLRYGDHELHRYRKGSHPVSQPGNAVRLAAVFVLSDSVGADRAQ